MARAFDNRAEKVQQQSSSPLHSRPLQRAAVNSAPVGETPPIVKDVLRSPGQPLDAATRAFMEPRFGHDFSAIKVHASGSAEQQEHAAGSAAERVLGNRVPQTEGIYDFGGVRIHTDVQAAESAQAISAQAYTVGHHIIFGPGQYMPNTQAGQQLIAHELTHVVQRQPYVRIQRQTIPPELQTSVDVSKLSDQELAERYDLIQSVLSQFTESTADTALLEEQAGNIGVELARRRALAEGRTFTEQAVKRMQAYFMRNAKTQEDGACIVALNKGVKLLLNDPKQPTTNETIEKTMAKIAASGRSSEAREIWFETKQGRMTKGSARPERLQESVWDAIMNMTGSDPGWSVFTMSLMDGNHTVTLSLDNTNPARPHVYWSDQWESKGGWKEYTKSTLDAEVTKLIQGWWDKQAEGKKFNTVVRLWRLRQGAQAQP